MDTEKVSKTVRAIARHYTEFLARKADYEAQVEAEISLLVAESEDRITKVDKKNIKKAGQALAQEKGQELKHEATSLADIIEIAES